MLPARAFRALFFLLIIGFATWLLVERAKSWRPGMFDRFGKNWRTSAGGGLTALLGLASFFGVEIIGVKPIDPQVAGGMFLTGLSLLFAKDQSVTGGDVRQQ